MARKVKYRNNEERVYMKTLVPLQNVLTYQEGILEELEERYSKVREAGGNSATNVINQLMPQRKLVVYIQELLAAITSREPRICRGE